MSGLTWCALALAPQARAATFAELPFAAQPGVATCLRATGDPGELTVLGPVTKTSAAIDVLRVGDTGDFETHLPAAAIAPSGAAVVVWPQVRTTSGPDRPWVRILAALRPAGGAFGPARALTPWRKASASTAMSPRPSTPPVAWSWHGRGA